MSLASWSGRVVAGLVALALIGGCTDDGPGAGSAETGSVAVPSIPPVATTSAVEVPPTAPAVTTAAVADTVAPSVVDDTAGLPPGIAIEVQFVPNLALLRRLEVSIDDTGPVDATITRLSFSSPLFAAVPSENIGDVVGAGRKRDVELALGEATCPTTLGPSVVTVGVDVGGQVGEGTLVVDAERLEQLNDRECGQRAVLERADIAFASDNTIAGDVLSTQLGVTRRSGTDELTVADIGGTLLFSVRPRGERGSLASLAPDDDAAAVDLTIEVHRCDAHTVSQSQLSYRFPVWVSVDGAEPQYVVIEPHPTLRAALEALVQSCIAREGTNGA